ncbi:putative protein [Arabidopsis thaliana]|uniref:Polynucleotidyl transferase, ribonuclease H-like superfamily protein n=2 Tax=Arabidopsis thaliana TaxID=3702 RepID=Q9LZQ8_ARATH|nr:Polynucleotidyl transferase, ribonuclease H-like superfamily protein [Arabidopsis thaliana]AEE80338.1 Polynucleotidyl transferase, ribonuclease H-like superfamily protein [Arabidopsis thaliana]OAP05636.1 hypothetical protein AXX17_AT3G56610 [Arabidopsis thaliana]CAB82946.1 putative protein [Arabidopsis thaliana]VYS61179.1 unnamed protein product [Arabidopsis thaliana]|eukprot:NP_191791.1 Polynucleotidyl transferase, ribonuclease H-like superfamily protein [Arabidopsis thaliana]
MSTSTVETGYGGRIRVTVARNDRDITSEVRTFLCNKENANKIIGLDTERSVVGGDSEYPPESKLVILELSDGQNCLIIPLPYVQGNKLPVSLTNFLNLPDFTFTGVGINKALKMLKSECGLTCKNAVDIGPSSPIYEDWDNDSLTEDQINLAAANAYLAFKVGNLIREAMY